VLRTRVHTRPPIEMPKIPRLSRKDRLPTPRPRTDHRPRRDQRRPCTPPRLVIPAIQQPPNRRSRRRARRPPPARVRAEALLRMPSNKLATAARARPAHRREPEPAATRPPPNAPRPTNLEPTHVAPLLAIAPRGELTPAAFTPLQDDLRFSRCSAYLRRSRSRYRQRSEQNADRGRSCRSISTPHSAQHPSGRRFTLPSARRFTLHHPRGEKPKLRGHARRGVTLETPPSRFGLQKRSRIPFPL
jgi:hypothetical protein